MTSQSVPANTMSDAGIVAALSSARNAPRARPVRLFGFNMDDSRARVIAIRNDVRLMFPGARAHLDAIVKEFDAVEREREAYNADYQRAALLLERLAEDHFPDQQTFDAWIAHQMQQALRRG